MVRCVHKLPILRLTVGPKTVGFVGPWDLGNNIGHPVKGDFDPELKEAIARVLKAFQDAGKKAGESKLLPPSRQPCNT